MTDFQQLNADYDLQYEKHLQLTGMEPETDRQEAFLAEERADRVREHGSVHGSACRLPLPGRRFPVDELAAQQALRPRSGQVTPLGVHVPEEEAA